MSRAELLTVVMRLLGELDDPACYGPDGESRYHEIVGLLSSVDWGTVPTDVIRAVFRTVIRKTPLDVLERAPHERNLFAEAQNSIESNAEIRAELSNETRAA